MLGDVQFGVLVKVLFGALFKVRVRLTAGCQVTVRAHFCKIDGRVQGGMQFGGAGAGGVLGCCLGCCLRFRRGCIFVRLTVGCKGTCSLGLVQAAFWDAV